MRNPSRFRLPLLSLATALACAEGTASTAPAASTAASAKPALEKPDAPAGADAARIGELAAKARPLVDAFLNSEALLTRDQKQVVLVSNRDGLPQLYLAD